MVTANQGIVRILNPLTRPLKIHLQIKRLGIKNYNKVIIGNSNINSLQNKFDQLKRISFKIS